MLLDIDMPGMDGLEIAAKMQQMETRPILIFVTSQDALVYDSFQYHPFGFIRKAYVDRELEQVLLEAVKEWKKQNHRYCFRCENEMVSLNTEQILYLESTGNYLELYTSFSCLTSNDKILKIKMKEMMCNGKDCHFKYKSKSKCSSGT